MKNTEVHVGMVVQFVGDDYDSREQAKQGLSFNVGTITELLTREPQTWEFTETAPGQKPTHVTVGQVRYMTDPRHTTWRVLPAHMSAIYGLNKILNEWTPEREAAALASRG